MVETVVDIIDRIIDDQIEDIESRIGWALYPNEGKIAIDELKFVREKIEEELDEYTESFPVIYEW